jgi:hypothetical protein
VHSEIYVAELTCGITCRGPVGACTRRGAGYRAWTQGYGEREKLVSVEMRRTRARQSAEDKSQTWAAA